ncbi:DUF1672 family protein [Rossellomorea marisflavi]|uniref:DUF1672 family protein n=1 Tax=Rossellomorea marisflavi TaxID=189381 RepID=UPI003D2F1DE5
MKHKWKLFVCGISISLLLGGCFGVENGGKSDVKKSHTKQDENARSEDVYESVLTYTGEGYDLPGGEETEKIAKDQKDEVVKATKDYLKKEYNTDIEVHNMVGNEDGVTVFYESTGNLHFYGTAIVPIDVKNKTVLSDQVWTLEGVVERGIRGALYAFIFEDKFKKLDSVLADLEKNENIVGRKVEAIENVGGIGYMTPYYFLANDNDDQAIEPVYDYYMKNPNASKEELLNEYKQNLFIPEDFLFSIQFYMKDQKKSPEEEILKTIVKTIEDNVGIPSGAYAINLHDNYVIREAAEGAKKNSISKKFPNGEIIKK